MTRKEREQVEKHFDELHAKATGITPNIQDVARKALKAAYMAGADYAVDMFAPRWISVEDELPPRFYMALFTDGVTVCVDILDNVQDNPYPITHWMPLPQPPTCSVFPNNLKKGEEQ